MIGTKLAHFEITSHLGSGGMGDVYQATDSKLGRSVAIKFLPEAFSHDGDRVARFQREARVLASLNHPNIAGIYGVEEINGRHFLIMELVPGETLADRIQRGDIRLDEALPIAKQMAEALEEAHEKGVIHRDLKPANIKVTPDGKIKVLDFGLAKAFERDQPDAALSNSPTIMSMGGTQAGVILGTAAYMAPEQARGKSVDKRADIWSFGVVLYEMVTRTPPFRGADLTDILAAVVRDKPDMSAAPQQLRRLLEACLQKDPRNRLRDIADVWKLFDEATAAAAESHNPPRRRRWLWPGVAAALAVIAAIGLWAPWREPQPANRPLLRFSADLGPEAARAPHNTVILSPDGTRIAYAARGEGGIRVYTRRLDQPDATLLVTGTAELPDLCFSPDGEWIGFVSGDRNLKKVAVQGGSAVTVGAMPGAQQFGLSWGDDDNIVIGTGAGLWSLPAAGGVARRLTEVAAMPALFPDILPGARAVLFSTRPQATNTLDGYNIEVLEPANGNKKTLVEGGYFPRYVPTSVETGHLLYMKGGTLFGVAFDPRSLSVLGTPQPLLSDVAASTDLVTGGGQFAASDTGTLVYLAGNIAANSYPLHWMDAAGKTMPLVAQPGVYGAPRLSPDGRQLAYIASGNGRFDVWVSDVASGSPSQLTFLGTVNWELAWAPDSKHLVYGDGKALWWIRSDGGGQAQLLADNQPTPRPTSFAPLVGKDTRLVFMSSPIGLPDLWTLPIDLSDPERPRAGKPEPFQAEPAIVEVDGAFSPDGKFIAYTSNESGAQQVFVRPFPGPGGRWRVSTVVGAFPTWSPATRELFFLGSDDRIMAASYAIGGSGGQEDSFSVVGTPRVWSSQPVRRDSVRQNFDVSRDGKRVVMFPRPAVENAGGNLHATFLLNFFDEVRRRAPSGGKK